MQAGATGERRAFTSVSGTRTTGEMESSGTNVKKGSASETAYGHAVGTRL
jgi:hypothetical protein